MRTLLASFALALAALGAAQADPLRVVTTTTDLKSLVELIGGDRVQVTAIAQGNQDPHHLDAKPSYILQARRADLWVRAGLDLEIGWEPVLLEGSRNRRIQIGTPGHLDASEGIEPLDVVGGIAHPLAGDIHPRGNPHYWADPWNGRLMAAAIADRLTKLAPSDAAYFAERLAAFQKRLDEAMFGPEPVTKLGGEKLWEAHRRGALDPLLGEQKLALGGWAAKMRPFRGAKLVTYHRSWVYFARRFGLEVAAELEPKPGVPPSPAHLRDVMGTIRDGKLRALLVEPFYDRRAADLVAERTGIQVLVVPLSVGGQEGVDDYLALIANLVDKMSAALTGDTP
jgi:ABC-type Zn uptake system ZnuABC Zn-binding protein ZnuA